MALQSPLSVDTPHFPHIDLNMGEGDDENEAGHVHEALEGGVARSPGEYGRVVVHLLILC